MNDFSIWQVIPHARVMRIIINLFQIKEIIVDILGVVCTLQKGDNFLLRANNLDSQFL